MKSKNTNARGWSHHLILPVLAIMLVASIGTYLVTKSSAYSYMSGVTPYSCKQDPTPTLKPNSSKNNKNCVRALQYMLNRWIAYKKPAGIKKLSIDGIYGSKTYTAVVAFQKKYKITANGTVGSKTWSKFLSCGVVSSCSKG
jgi:peptidoglycan hydrolase-like protein with peptidoglycan-binding domain